MVKSSRREFLTLPPIASISAVGMALHGSASNAAVALIGFDTAGAPSDGSRAEGGALVVAVPVTSVPQPPAKSDTAAAKSKKRFMSCLPARATKGVIYP
ncbi:hypothetical protein H074_22819 [Amycolatopsis decaplanina DSM 44594]|uniref:Uncharacterized protein n=1 Tax=Amycolatopsis decaplanina DSM 44594 TaxID=1284240 RepID=M2X6Q4_9PSEU|nr:hypothetical protein H074_22819 [Amycolatopsis decaplanina DSM 44594]